MNQSLAHLLQALTDEDSFIRLIAAGSLGQFKDPSIVDPLIETLEDPDPDVRRAAAASLGALQTPRVIDPLLCALKDPHVHETAARALREFDNPILIPGLITALESNEEAIRRAAASLLGAYRDPGIIQPLTNALRDEKWMVRKEAVRSLSSFKVLPVVHALIRSLQDSHIEVREAAATSLIAFGDPVATHVLVQALKHNEEFIRQTAASALGTIDDPIVIVPLIRALGDRHGEVRLRAAEALSQRTEPVVVPSLVKALKHADANVRSLAAKTLETFEAASVVATLSDAILDEDFHDRKEAVELMGTFNDEIVIRPLIEVLADPNKDVRTLATRALQMHVPSRVVSPLIEAMSNDAFPSKSEAVALLGSFDHPDILPPLLHALREKDADIREEAIEAMRKYSHPVSASAIAGFLSAEASSLRELAALLLGRSKDPRAINPLIQALYDPESIVQVAVIKALSTFYTLRVSNVLTGMLEHDLYAVRRAALEALEPMGSFHELSPLLEEMKKWDSEPHSIPAVIMVSLFLNGHRKIAFTLSNAMLFHDLVNQNNINIKNRVLGVQALQKLITYEEWRHLAFFIKKDISNDKVLFGDLKLALNNTYALQKKEAPVLLCTDHVARFARIKLNGFTYLGCRICGETHRAVRAKNIVAVLDESMRERIEQTDASYKVNWLKTRQLYDFDEVEIGACSDDDIKAFCIETGNDSDPYRLRRSSQLPCTIRPGTVLSEEIMNILHQHFKKVSREQALSE